jgi:hypothetical protein
MEDAGKRNVKNQNGVLKVQRKYDSKEANSKDVSGARYAGPHRTGWSDRTGSGR